MITLRQYLLDVLTIIKPFRKNISHLMLRTQDDGQAIAMATAVDGSMVIDLKSTVPITDFSGAGCFGALDFLYALLTSPHAEKRNFGMDIKTATIDRRGKDVEMVKGIHFTCGKRFDVFYQATNIAAITGRNARGAGMGARLANIGCDYTFGVDSDLVDEFNNVCRIYSTMPKTKTSSDTIFGLTVSQGGAVVQFASGPNQMDVTLADQVECIGKSDNITVNLPIQETKNVLGLLGDNSTCDVCPDYIKFNSEYENMEVSYVLTAMKKAANTRQ